MDGADQRLEAVGGKALVVLAALRAKRLVHARAESSEHRLEQRRADDPPALDVERDIARERVEERLTAAGRAAQRTLQVERTLEPIRLLRIAREQRIAVGALRLERDLVARPVEELRDVRVDANRLVGCARDQIARAQVGAVQLDRAIQ